MIRYSIFILLLFSSVFAAGVTIGNDANASAVMIGIYAQVETNATTQAEYESFLGENSLIVLGSSMDISERILLDGAKSQNPWLAKAQEGNDSAAVRTAILSGRHPLALLIGGPEQNNITAYGIANGWFNDTRTVEGGLIVKSGKLPNGAVVVAISDKMGFEPGAVKNEGAKYSPLNAVMAPEYVPVAATGISLILLILINVGRTVFEFKALDLGRKGRKVGEGAMMYRGYNVTEGLAIVGASAVLGVSISWQYFGPSGDFVFWVFVNTIICLLGAILHEVTHRIFAHYFNIKMEYRFWTEGSALTLVSSYLGNAFSIQAFILEEIPKDVPKWKVGLMKLSAPLVSALVMVIFAFLYYQSPNPVFKTVYSTSALWAIAEILPFGSLDGKDIKDWSHTIWFVSFCFIGMTYLAVTFLI
ncbi:MAG: hypothetical protein V1861_04255 [Candidatus Micrarchaeota archaeon]